MNISVFSRFNFISPAGNTIQSINRVSTTPGNPGNLLEFVWSWNFLCNTSMIDRIGFLS